MKNLLREMLVFASLLLIPYGKVKSQVQAQSQSGAAILQSFDRLKESASVLYLAAHPDDENNRLLAYLGKGLSIRTAYLALNRGEGGQNLIGSEQGDALGLVRSRELLAARAADGARQFFTRAYDFGYSRSPAETFQHWPKDSILSDVVWVIRRFRPDIIVNRFPATGEGGHGHHTASAILSLEAVKAAADPRRFPDQLKFVKPWQVRSVFWNTFNFGGINTQREDQIKLDVGGYNSLLGKSYGEIAAEGRSSHKSQGFGTGARRGSEFEYFVQLYGDPVKSSILEGIDQSWKRIQGGGSAAALIEEAAQKLDIREPWKVIPLLCKAWQSVELIKDPFWKEIKRDELQDLIKDCQGIWVDAEAPLGDYAAGESIPVKVNFISRNPGAVHISSIGANSTNLSSADSLRVNSPGSLETVFRTDSTMISQPYWLKKPHPSDFYTVESQNLQRGLPYTINPATVSLTFKIAGCTFSYQTPIVHRSVDPALGERFEDIRILPPVTLNFMPSQLIWTGKKQSHLQLDVHSYTDSVSTQIHFQVPAGFVIQPAAVTISVQRGESRIIDLNLFASGKRASITPLPPGMLSAYCITKNQMCKQSIHEAGYEHTGKITWFTPAQTRIVPVSVNAPSRNIAYIEGAGDQVAGVLQQLGYKVHVLTDEELLNADLSPYATIITGVRAFNVRKSLSVANRRLLAYVKNGGNVIVQYNNPNGLQVTAPGPYPFSLTSGRITNENAPVKVLAPGASMLHYPNTITDRDFSGWVQERGLYFAANEDPRYQRLFGMKEEGTSELDTAVLYAPYGKGNYIYTSLAFFRQLPAGVAGAIRLFANMISMPPNGK